MGQRRPGRPSASDLAGHRNAKRLRSARPASWVRGRWLGELAAARHDVSREVERAGAEVLDLAELRRALGVEGEPGERARVAAERCARLRGAPLGCPTERAALREALAVARNAALWTAGARGRPEDAAHVFADALQATPWGYSLGAALAAAEALGFSLGAGNASARAKQALRRRRSAS